MINRVVLVGRITRDPELKNTQSNIPYVNFSIACGRNFLDRQGVRQEQTDFINCVVWNKQAENLARYVKKGSLIGVEGRIQTRSYEYEGQTRNVTEVFCENIQFLESRATAENREQYQPRQVQNRPDERQAQNDVFSNKTTDVAEDDLPF